MLGRVRTVALALTMIASGVPTSARAQPDPAVAREHFNAGIRLYDKNDFEGALVEFRAAQESRPSPQIVVNIALCLRKLGRNAEAIDALELLLLDPKVDATTRSATERTLGELRAKAATIRIRLVLNVAPGTRAPEPTVTIDGEPLAPAKVLQPIWVDPGAHVVAARASGFPEVASTVTPKAGEREVVVDLSLVATLTTSEPEPSLDVKVDPPPIPPPRIAIAAETKWYLGASVGFFGGELPVHPDLGGAQGLIGGMFVGRLGRRFGNHFSVEIDGEIMGAGTRESPVAGTSTKRSFAVSHIALGAGPRFVTSTNSPRFTIASIGGVVNQKIVQNDHPEGVTHPHDGAPTGFLQLEAGMQLDAKTVTLEAVAFIGMLGLNSDNYLSALHTVMTRYGAKLALQFSF